MADDAPPPGAPLWIVSFADMISNIVTFFILLAAFSTPSPYDTDVRDQAVTAKEKGVFAGASKKRAVVSRRGGEDTKAEGEGTEKSSRRSEKSLDGKLDTFVQDASYKVKPDLERLDDGLRITLAADRVFGPGEWVPKGEHADVIEEIGRYFRGEGCVFVVEAHVDGRTHRTSGVESPFDLSRRMALAVASVLTDRAGVPAHRVGIAPLGASQPIASDDEAAGRAKNRRIAIVVRKGS